MPVRKVSRNPANDTRFIYLPKPWFDAKTRTGWSGREVKITQTSRLTVEPYPTEQPTLITSKTPLRLPIGGGGTDLPEYYTKHGGFWISTTINNYIHIILKKRFEEKSKFVYSETQYVNNPSQFTHPILRAVFTKYNTIKHIELISLADLPSGIGLGSSGSFTVGLLNAINYFLGQEKNPKQLAEEAYEIERLTLGRKIGKQDQYASAYGETNAFHISKRGTVKVETLNLSPNFEKWLLLFYVNQRQIPTWKAAITMPNSDRRDIARLGKRIYYSLLGNNFYEFGELMNMHWQIKSKYQPDIFKSIINKAKNHGAIGGKLVGAGGGGCILLVCPPEKQLSVIESLNIKQIQFKLEPFGSEVS